MNDLRNIIHKVLKKNSQEKNLLEIANQISLQIKTLPIYSSIKSDEYSGTFNMVFFYSYEDALKNAKELAEQHYKDIEEIVSQGKVIAYRSAKKNFNGHEFYVEKIIIG